MYVYALDTPHISSPFWLPRMVTLHKKCSNRRFPFSIHYHAFPRTVVQSNVRAFIQSRSVRQRHMFLTALMSSTLQTAYIYQRTSCLYESMRLSFARKIADQGSHPSVSSR